MRRRKPLACLLGFHDLYFGGPPPMWSKCRKCGYFR